MTDRLRFARDRNYNFPARRLGKLEAFLQQLRIVLFQDEFHLSRTALFRQISRTTHPPPAADRTST